MRGCLVQVPFEDYIRKLKFKQFHGNDSGRKSTI